MVLDLRLSKDWDVEMTSFLFFTLFPTLFWTALRAFGTASGLWPHLERALAHLELSGTIWNARSANGTTWNYLELFGTREAHLERPPGF